MYIDISNQITACETTKSDLTAFVTTESGFYSLRNYQTSVST